MAEFFGRKITEQEADEIYRLAVTGMGHCQALLEFASTLEDRLFAVAAHEAYRTIMNAVVAQMVERRE